MPGFGLFLNRRPALRRVRGSGPSAATGGATRGRFDRLEQLADLHDRGGLIEGQFGVEKVKILRER